jgi:hypothetical protein
LGRFYGFVIWLTVLARKRAHYPAGGCRKKLCKVLIPEWIRGFTLEGPIALPWNKEILRGAPVNTMKRRQDRRKERVRAPQMWRVTQAKDGFGMAGSMICKLCRLLNKY